MPLDNVTPGAGSVPEYVVPGIPWVTASTVAAATTKEHAFPAVCSSIHVYCTSGSAGALQLGFTAAGVAGSRALSFAPGTRADLPVRTRSLFVRGLGGVATYELLVGLTLIKKDNYPVYSGSTSTDYPASLMSGV